MSHDLYLAAAEGPFGEVFEGRRGYSVGAQHVAYENEDTGAYFTLEPADEVPDGGEGRWLLLTLNLVRPHWFALEAAEELDWFAQRSPGLVCDPQDDDVVRAWSRDRFVASWESSNRAGRRTLAHAATGITQHTLPRELLARIWRWNRSRAERNDALGADVFVPKVSFLASGDRAMSFAVWSDAMPVHLPRVDLVAVRRGAIHPRRWFRRRAEPDFALVPWDELMVRLPEADVRAARARESEGELPFVDLAAFRPSREFLAFLCGRPTMAAASPLGADEVLDADP